MIAGNPMAEYGVEYVIHTQDPRFIAKRVYDNPESDFEIVQGIDDMANFFKDDPQKLAGLMRRLGDWYVSYCEWDKEQNYDEDEYNG